jgi:hypothetical protein
MTAPEISRIRFRTECLEHRSRLRQGATRSSYAALGESLTFRRDAAYPAAVKASLILLVLAGCAEPMRDPRHTIDSCKVDTECNTGVCARTGECLPTVEVRKAEVVWTMAGQPPNDQSCYWFPTVNVEFWTEPEIDQGEVWRTEPVPCTLGKFTVDKLPLRFWIGGVKSPSAGMWVPLDDAGVARVDLP